MLIRWDSTKLLNCGLVSLNRTLNSGASSVGRGSFISTRYAATRFCMGLLPSISTCRRTPRPCEQTTPISKIISFIDLQKLLNQVTRLLRNRDQPVGLDGSLLHNSIGCRLVHTLNDSSSESGTGRNHSRSHVPNNLKHQKKHTDIMSSL